MTTTFVQRYGPIQVRSGIGTYPASLFRLRRALGLDVEHVYFIVLIFNWYWGESWPQISFHTLARYTGHSRQTLVNWARALVAKGYLQLEGEEREAYRFNFRNLLDRLDELTEGDASTDEACSPDNRPHPAGAALMANDPTPSPIERPAPLQPGLRPPVPLVGVLQGAPARRRLPVVPDARTVRSAHRLPRPEARHPTDARPGLAQHARPPLAQHARPDLVRHARPHEDPNSIRSEHEETGSSPHHQIEMAFRRVAVLIGVSLDRHAVFRLWENSSVDAQRFIEGMRRAGDAARRWEPRYRNEVFLRCLTDLIAPRPHSTLVATHPGTDPVSLTGTRPWSIRDGKPCVVAGDADTG